MKNIYVIYTIIIFTIIYISPSIHAVKETDHIALLTVIEGTNTSVERGGVADLQLTIKEGTGRIFIDSFPLSKIDTQITFRFANELACDFLDMDCSQYDFFYTIKANSAIVGGPSAGAAATVLTIAMLDDQHLDEKTVMTGTINSGNLIGPVAGIAAKTRAAQDNGYTKALIPKWDVANETPNQDLTIKIIPVSTVEEALYAFTGKNYSVDVPSKISSEQYNAFMKKIATELCSKYGSVENNVIIMPNLSMIIPHYQQSEQDVDLENGSSNESINVTSAPSRDFFTLAADAINHGQYYSAASYCFGGNVRITAEHLKNMSAKDIPRTVVGLSQNIHDFEREIEKNFSTISTIPQLETYMVVKERLAEAKDILVTPNITTRDIAYATERLHTAKVWSQFSDFPGRKFVLDTESLKKGCSQKLSEAEERINYLQTYYPREIDRKDLLAAYEYYNEGEFALCIFTASKVKANVDVVISVIFVPEKNLEQLYDEKITAAKRVIASQESHDIFPILGYSYYEYSESLHAGDVYPSLSYAEYALELSNLDMYFPVQRSNHTITSHFNYAPIGIFIAGFAIGILVMYVGYAHRKKTVKKNSKK
jgi:uncharacterized protein